MPGTITFKPVQAKLTHDTEWFGAMDPYCQFTVGKEKARSQVCKGGGKTPHWEDIVTVNSTGASECLIELKDKDKVVPDDVVGSCVISLQEIESQGRVSKWYPIFYHNKPAGEVLLEATFQSGSTGHFQPTQPGFSTGNLTSGPTHPSVGMSQEQKLPHGLGNEHLMRNEPQTHTQGEFMSRPQSDYNKTTITTITSEYVVPTGIQSSNLQGGSHYGSNMPMGTGLGQGTMDQESSHLQGGMHSGSNMPMGTGLGGGMMGQESSHLQGGMHSGSNMPVSSGLGGGMQTGQGFSNLQGGSHHGSHMPMDTGLGGGTMGQESSHLQEGMHSGSNVPMGTGLGGGMIGKGLSHLQGGSHHGSNMPMETGLGGGMQTGQGFSNLQGGSHNGSNMPMGTGLGQGMMGQESSHLQGGTHSGSNMPMGTGLGGGMMGQGSSHALGGLNPSSHIPAGTGSTSRDYEPRGIPSSGEVLEKGLHEKGTHDEGVTAGHSGIIGGLKGTITRGVDKLFHK